MKFKSRGFKETPENLLFFEVPLSKVNKSLFRNIKPTCKFTSYDIHDTIVYIAIPNWVDYNKELEEFGVCYGGEKQQVRNFEITVSIYDLICLLPEISKSFYYTVIIPNNDEYILPAWYQERCMSCRVDFTNWLEESQKFPRSSQPLDKICKVKICGRSEDLIKFCNKMLKKQTNLNILIQQLKQFLENNEKSSN